MTGENRFVVVRNSEGRLESADFVPVEGPLTQEAAAELEAIKQQKSSPAHINTDKSPDLRLAGHEFGVLGLSSIQRHVWGE